MPTFDLKNNHLAIKVNSFGAELSSVLSSENHLEYIWQADKTVWPRHAPHLFPIVGKLKKGEYLYNSNTFCLPQHGFARDMEFDCVEQTASKLVFQLKHNETTVKNYPFQFAYKVIYYLENSTLKIEYNVSNLGQDEMYFSVGAHPGFNCPLSNDEFFEDYELVFPNSTNLKINALQDGLISNGTKEIALSNFRLDIKQDLFASDALVFTNYQVNEVSLISKKTKHGVTLTAVNWPYFGIWAKPGTSRFVCLEPWQGIADFTEASGNLVEKTGIIKLEPSQNFTCEFSMNFF